MTFGALVEELTGVMPATVARDAVEAAIARGELRSCIESESLFRRFVSADHLVPSLREVKR